MSVQSTLTSFYNARKRSSVDEIKKHSKVRVLDGGYNESTNVPDAEENDSVLLIHKTQEVVDSVVLVENRDSLSATAPKINNRDCNTTVNVKTPRRTKETKGKKSQVKPTLSINQASLRDLFSNLKGKAQESVRVKSSEEVNVEAAELQQSDTGGSSKEPVGVPESSKQVKEDAAVETLEKVVQSPKKASVIFEKMGGLSPRKVVDIKLEDKVMTSSECAVSAEEKNAVCQKKGSHAAAAVSSKLTKMSRKELSLSDIRGRLKGHSRLAELRESIERVSSCAAKIRAADKDCDVGVMPSLKKFQSIEFEVPVLMSPKKNMPASPCKTPPTSPIPAYQRFNHLTASRAALSPTKVLPASPSKASPLNLPYQHRCLAEVFRCVDLVVSMMYNRKEKISFNKMRPAAQELLRKNVTERHLGQIIKVFPESYEFHYEKINQLTVSSARAEHHELIITPILKSKNDGTKSFGSMSPSVLLERRHIFHKNLLELVKDHHEEFLRSLDPPMVVPREKLTRWHPSFEVDILPEVEPAEMPEPPDAPEKCSSAKDVLSKARDLFGCNKRMQQALERVSVSDSKHKTGECGPSTSCSSPSKDVPLLNPALKGIPPALLKKVRERQAAKALVAMTMSPADEKRAERLSRLPELARVIRGIFISERKGVLSLDVLLQKLSDSYRSGLSSSEMEELLKLLEESVPGWLSRCTIRHAHYIKLSRDADLSRVLAKLEMLLNDAKTC